MGFFLSPWKTRRVILGSCKEYSGLIETQYLVWKGHFPFTTLYLAFSDCKCIIKYTKITQLNQTSLYSMQPFLYVFFFLSRILIWQTCKLNVIFCFFTVCIHQQQGHDDFICNISLWSNRYPHNVIRKFTLPDCQLMQVYMAGCIRSQK